MVEIELVIKPVGEKIYKRIVPIFEFNDISLIEADALFEGKYNSIIWEAVYDSKYNCLDNWHVENVKNDATLGFESFKKWYPKLNKFKNKKDKDKHSVFSNCWIDRSGKCINVPHSHINYALDEFRRLFGRNNEFEDVIGRLESLGYIRCQSWHRIAKNLSFFSGKEPNRQQWKTIIRICSVFNSELPIFN